MDNYTKEMIEYLAEQQGGFYAKIILYVNKNIASKSFLKNFDK